MDIDLIRKAFKKIDSDGDGKINLKEFLLLISKILDNQQVHGIFRKYSPQKRYMVPEDIQNFLTNIQKEPDIDLAHCSALCRRVTPVMENSTPKQEDEKSKRKERLYFSGFMRYILSHEHNNVVDPYKSQNVYQDMTLPLPNYFMASSHNTYLLGDQLKVSILFIFTFTIFYKAFSLPSLTRDVNSCLCVLHFLLFTYFQSFFSLFFFPISFSTLYPSSSFFTRTFYPNFYSTS